MNHLNRDVQPARPSPFYAEDPEVERELQALQDGNARYSTGKEDALVIGILVLISALLIGGVYLCVHFGGLR